MNIFFCLNFLESVKATNANVTDKDVNSLIQKWLRQAPGRKGGDKVKKKKTNNGNPIENTEENNTKESPASIIDNSNEGSNSNAGETGQ
jgi:hypothetical protein